VGEPDPSEEHEDPHGDPIEHEYIDRGRKGAILIPGYEPNLEVAQTGRVEIDMRRLEVEKKGHQNEDDPGSDHDILPIVDAYPVGIFQGPIGDDGSHHGDEKDGEQEGEVVDGGKESNENDREEKEAGFVPGIEGPGEGPEKDGQQTDERASGGSIPGGYEGDGRGEGEKQSGGELHLELIRHLSGEHEHAHDPEK